MAGAESENGYGRLLHTLSRRADVHPVGSHRLGGSAYLQRCLHHAKEEEKSNDGGLSAAVSGCKGYNGYAS